jgi:hypothetical protein
MYARQLKNIFSPSLLFGAHAIDSRMASIVPIFDVLAKTDKSFVRMVDCDISSATPHAAPAVIAVCLIMTDDDEPSPSLLRHWTMAEHKYDKSSMSMRKLPTSWTVVVPPREPCPPIAAIGVLLVVESGVPPVLVVVVVVVIA